MTGRVVCMCACACACACSCVCVSGSLTGKLFFDQVYDALKWTTLKGFCLAAGPLTAHHWHHFTLSVSKVHSLLIYWRNGEDNDDVSLCVEVPAPLFYCSLPHRLTIIVSFAMTSPPRLQAFLFHCAENWEHNYFFKAFLMSFICDISCMI